MIKKISVDYSRDPVTSRDVVCAMRVSINGSALTTDNDRREFALMLDEVVAVAVSKWELNRLA